EFVVLGKTSGTSFIEITDPLNPIYLGDLATHTVSSLWRDVKVYDHYAFIVSEAGGHGMQVFDLEQLLTVVAPPVAFAESAHYDLFGNAHNIVINESVARAYAVGTNTFSGGLHIIDISDPLNPAIMGDYATDGYTHDAQVVTYNGPDVAYQGMEIAINCNEDAVTIANVDDPTDTQTLSITAYANSSYTHQGWLTDDHTHLLVNDELDETNNGTNTRTFIFDVSDLDAPVFMGFYESTTAAIDHNHYVDKNLLYQANYRAGLRILDIQDVANTNVSEVAYFDMYPSSNSNAFNGAWSNYPYFPSGVLAVSHIESGLFLLRPQFVHASATEELVCFEDDYVIDISVEAGFVGPVALSVTQGLPPGAVATFSSNNVGPGSYTLTLS
ncbi:MAG: choice-of-anchor B family protein, partial [Flavobacteriales bacterium]